MRMTRTLPALMSLCACWLGSGIPTTTEADILLDFEQRYFMEPGLIAADHTLREVEGTFHLYYTVGIQGEGWSVPGNMIDLGHAETTDFINWTIHPRILPTEAPGWKERNVWAPHILKLDDGSNAIFYAGVDSTISQEIGIATSTDLFTWTDLPENPVYRPDTTWAYWDDDAWANCRDPFVMQVNDTTWAMLTTAETKVGYQGLPNRRGAVSLAYGSVTDGWVDAGAPMFINNSFRVLESTYMVENAGLWYLFYTEGGVSGVQYMTSTEQFSGYDKITATTFEIDAFAAEIFDDGHDLYYARIRDGIWANESILGVKIDDFAWDGTTPTMAENNRMLENWTIISGNAFDVQPTFGDRPQDAGGPASNLHGFFWINTAEQHGGPIVWGCPECPPDETMTGVLRSNVFPLTKDYISFRIGGGDDIDDLYVSLHRANGEELRRATGAGVDAMHDVLWDMRDLDNESVYFEIVDQSATGHVNVDWVRDLDDLTSVGLACDPGGPYNGNTAAPIQFAAVVSAAEGRTIVGYDWEFGDGATSTDPMPTHLYAATGTYTVTLTITDNFGDTAFCATTATISIPPQTIPPNCDAGGPYILGLDESVPFLAVPNSFSQNLGVIVGDGAGNFEPMSFYPAGTRPRVIAVGDVNGDLADDVVAANNDSDDVHVYLGVGDGTFVFDESYRIGDRPFGMTLADVDGNGHLDIIAANWNSSSVGVLIGAGDGTFSSLAGYSSGGIFATDVRAGDLNGDEVVDLVVTNWLFGLGVLIGNGDGTFAPVSTYQGGSFNQSAVALADVDGDENLDVIAACFDADEVCVLLGVGDGTLQSAVSYEIGNEPLDIEVADLDGVGGLDLVVALRRDGIAVVQGDGAGAFGPPTEYETSGDDISGVVLGDLNGDTLLDAAVSDRDEDAIDVLLGDGAAGFGTFTTHPAGNQPYDIGIGGLVVAEGVFDGSGSNDPDGQIVEYLWDFGDGTIGTGIAPEHTYRLAGLYTITLCVIDDDGAETCCATTVTVGNELPPVCDNGGPYEGLAGTAINFDGTESFDPDGSIVAYDWQFGDGATATGASPSHAYQSIGTFTVTLCTTDDDDLVACCETTAVIQSNAAVDDQPVAPRQLTLERSRPNPFNPSTTITFGLPADDDVSLRIYDTLGRSVRTLASGRFEAGFHSMRWDGTNDRGQSLGSGVYLYELRYRGEVRRSKVVLVK